MERLILLAVIPQKNNLNNNKQSEFTKVITKEFYRIINYTLSVN